MEDQRGYFVGLQDGKLFHYDGQDPSEVRLSDIARSLSRLDRYNGHGRYRWTVATHSLHVAWVVNEIGFPNLVLEAMLHDGEEAYVGDVIAPMKRALYPHYHDFLAPIRDCVRAAFGLEGALSEHTREADTFVSYLETAHLFSHSTWEHTWKQPVPIMAGVLDNVIPDEIKLFSKLPAEEQEQRFKDGVLAELMRELTRSLETAKD
jgi:hypothetical protein